VHEDQLPSLFLDPVLSLDQLIELLVTEDSSEVSQEDNEERLFLRGHQKRGAIC